MYFTIGGLRSGGTTTQDMVLIGTEIATGNPATVVSEFPDQWLAGVFKEQSPENLIPLNIHEYVHTQQKGKSQNLLAQAIREGSCDFITELVMGQPLHTSYIKYGNEHEVPLKEKFKQEMFSKAFSRWLYNSSHAEAVADLGYFMGYAICKSYYNQASNKKQAIKEIINLNYSDNKKVEAFLKKSAYYNEPFDKAQLIRDFEARLPLLSTLEPFSNGNTAVDASHNEITLVFSKPMGKGYSLDYGTKGKDYFPITGVTGFSADKKKLTLKMTLQPDHEYEFIVTDGGFKSEDGYPLLKPYTIKFKTKP